MKIGTGTDIIEIDRVRKSIENIGEKFVTEIYTPNEIAYCEGKKNAKFQHYAARFAAKEAVYKALNNIIEDRFSISWQNVEILNNRNGKPYINFRQIEFPNILSIDISLSHCKEFAVANVVMLYEGEIVNEVV